MRKTEQLIHDQANETDQDDADENLVGLQEALRLQNRIANAG